jgi:hypothetical protein
VRRAAAYVTRSRPGHGAIREICDLILAAKGRLPARNEGLAEAKRTAMTTARVDGPARRTDPAKRAANRGAVKRPTR